MPPEIAKYLQDARQACEVLLQITKGKSFQDYTADVVLRLAVERAFIIIGETLMQASKLAPGLEQLVPALRQAVGFRNVLVHGYAVVQHKTVWETVENDVATLQKHMEDLLAKCGPP